MKKSLKTDKFYIIGVIFTTILVLLIVAQLPILWILAFLLLPVYFLPTIITVSGGETKIGSIFLLNLLLGWFIVYWIAMLQWALEKNALKVKKNMQAKRGNNIGEIRKIKYLQG